MQLDLSADVGVDRSSSASRIPGKKTPPSSARRSRRRGAAGLLAWGLLPAVLVGALSRAGASHAYASPPFLVLAFWAAVYDFERRGGGVGGEAPRLAFGLGLGVLFAHLGWVLLHPSVVRADPRILLELRGFSSLFLPLGVLALAPWRGDRRRYLAAGVGCLALGLAVARLGCVLAGCCRGAPTDTLFAVAGRFPTRWLEWAGLLALALATDRLPRRWVAPVTLIGYGALRLALEPLRAADPAAPTLFAPAWLAAGWLLIGSAWVLRQGIPRLAPPTGKPP